MNARGKWLARAAAFILLMGPAGRTMAQGADELGSFSAGRGNDQYASDREFGVELRFGRYAPKVDEEFDNGKQPYKDTFGDGMRFSFGMEFDWLALQFPKVGYLGPAYGIAYTRSTADAPYTAPERGGERSAQSTQLAILPMYLVAAFRSTTLWELWGIPVIPYGKAGFGYALWWTDTDGDTETDAAGEAGKGTSLGLQYALGGMLLLNFLDQQTALDMDDSTGVNSTFLFGEWYNSYFNDIFRDDQLNVGTSTWVVGLAMEL